MSPALSQPGARRHPLGLSAVIGLHVVLAAALLCAKIDKTAPPPPGAIDIVAQPPRPPKPVDADLPPPARAWPQQPVLQVPAIPDAPADAAIVAQLLDPADRHEPAVADRSAPVAPAEASMRVQPRPASINAGASQCRPDYPAAAARSGATGVTRIRFTVDAAGQVAGARIVGSSGPSREHRLLDKAAAEALARCPIVVGTDDLGRPVGTTVDVEYDWKLD
jgi:protein TonB